MARVITCDGCQREMGRYRSGEYEHRKGPLHVAKVWVGGILLDVSPADDICGDCFVKALRESGLREWTVVP